MNAAGTADSKQDAEANQQVILIVDGRPVRLFYTSIYLQRAKYQVVMARNAEDARTFLGLTVPQAVISDLNLPGGGGLELLKHMRQDHRTRNVPFIVYTTNKDPEERQACEAAGCAAYLVHPAGLEALYAAVQKATRAKPRNFVRLDTALDVVVGDDQQAGAAQQHLIIAISEQGMFVSTNTPLELGSIAPFTFHLPHGKGRFFRVEGQVLYNRTGADKRKLPGMAVKFLKMSMEDREFLKNFIGQKLMEGIALVREADGDGTLRARLVS